MFKKHFSVNKYNIRKQKAKIFLVGSTASR